MINPYIYPGLKNFKLPKQYSGKFRVNIGEIYSLIEDKFGISKEKLQSKTRKRECTELRQILYYIMYEKYGKSLKSIGEEFGKRDHTTVIHGIQTLTDLYHNNQQYKENYCEILERFNIPAPSIGSHRRGSIKRKRNKNEKNS